MHDAIITHTLSNADCQAPAYKQPPPKAGEHTDEVLIEMLDLSEEEIAALREAGTI